MSVPLIFKKIWMEGVCALNLYHVQFAIMEQNQADAHILAFIWENHMATQTLQLCIKQPQVYNI